MPSVDLSKYSFLESDWEVYKDAFEPSIPPRRPKAWERAPVPAYAPRLQGQQIWKRVGLRSQHNKENCEHTELELEKAGTGARKKQKVTGAQDNIRDAPWMEENLASNPNIASLALHQGGVSPRKAREHESGLQFVPRKRTNTSRVITPRKPSRHATAYSPAKITTASLKGMEEAVEKPGFRRRKSVRKSFRKSAKIEEVPPPGTSVVEKVVQSRSVGTEILDLAQQFATEEKTAPHDEVTSRLEIAMQAPSTPSTPLPDNTDVQPATPAAVTRNSTSDIGPCEQTQFELGFAQGSSLALCSRAELPVEETERLTFKAIQPEIHKASEMIDEASLHATKKVHTPTMTAPDLSTFSRVVENGPTNLQAVQEEPESQPKTELRTPKTPKAPKTGNDRRQSTRRSARLSKRSSRASSLHLEIVTASKEKVPQQPNFAFTTSIDDLEQAVAIDVSPAKAVSTPHSADKQDIDPLPNAIQAVGDISINEASTHSTTPDNTEDNRAGHLALIAVGDEVAPPLLEWSAHSNQPIIANLEIDQTEIPVTTTAPRETSLSIEELLSKSTSDPDVFIETSNDMSASSYQENCGDSLVATPPKLNSGSAQTEADSNFDPTDENEELEPISLASLDEDAFTLNGAMDLTEVVGPSTPDPVATELTETICKNATSTAYDNDDTDMLRNFLTRVKANKAAKAASKKKRSLPHSPIRLPLGEVDNNISPSPQKMKDDFDVSLPSPSPTKRRKSGPTSAAGEEESSKAIRRSGRTRLPVIKTTPGGPSHIPVRRLGQDQDATVTLKRSDEKEVAALTRVNTRKNKGCALSVQEMMTKKLGESGPGKEDKGLRQKYLKEVFEEKQRRVGKREEKGKQAKNVEWAEELVRWQGKETVTVKPNDEKKKKVVVAALGNSSEAGEKGTTHEECEGEKSVQEKTPKKNAAKASVKVGVKSSQIAVGMAGNGTPAPKRRIRGKS